MSLAAIRKKAKLKPPIMVLYGPGGIGKTTFAASMGNTIIVQSEDGIGKIECDHFPWEEGKEGENAIYPQDSQWFGTHGVIMVQTEDGIGKIECDHYDCAESWEEFMENLRECVQRPHKIVGVDSLDWAEGLLWRHVCEQNGWAQIDTPAYGKGYVAALNEWKEYLSVVDELRDAGKIVVQIAHNEIKRYEDPTQDPMDRHQIKLHRKASDLIVEHADAVFFCARKLGTVSVKGKSGGMTTKVHKGERTIFTEDDPGYLAKNRYGLPPELPMDWEIIRKEMLK
jgi:hypothetical protein